MENTTNNENEFKNVPTALIIGASSGIGYHTAIKLADKGYEVYNASRTPCTDERVINIELDVCKTASLSLGINKFLSSATRLDVLIYSAGCSMAAPIEFAKLSDVKNLFDVNYFGALKVTQKLIPHFRAQGFGRILLVSSLASSLPIAFDSFYCSSKAALDMLARGINIELEPFGIRAVSVQPGGTGTRFTFKRNVYRDDLVGVYAERMNNAVEVIAKKEQEGMSPMSVAECLVSLAEAKNPPETAVCGFANKTYKLMNRILPQRVMEMILANNYKN